MKTRKRLSIAITLATLLLAVATWSTFEPVAQAADDGQPHPEPCTLANVAGAYGAYGSGTFLPGNALGLPPGAFSTVGRVEFGKHGSFTITSQTASFNGDIVRNIQGVGTFTVNADCTGTIDEGADKADLVFVDNRNEAFVIDNSTGLVTTFVFKRINSRQ